jgi:hypothetical protein
MMHHTPYVNGDTQTQSCLLCKSGAALPSPPLAPGTPSLLTGSVGTVGFSAPHPTLIPVSLWNAGLTAGGRCRLTSDKPPAWADLRCCACGLVELWTTTRRLKCSGSSSSSTVAAAAATLQSSRRLCARGVTVIGLRAPRSRTSWAVTVMHPLMCCATELVCFPGRILGLLHAIELEA